MVSRRRPGSKPSFSGTRSGKGFSGRATMPAELVPNAQIPGLPARVDTPEMFNVLRHIEEAGYIQNVGSLGDATFRILQQLARLGLVDHGFTEPTDPQPQTWACNGNGSRVLKYLADEVKTNGPSPGRVTAMEQTHETGLHNEAMGAVADFPALGTPEWSRMNQRRAELIRKKNRQGLSPDEQVEYERLQRLSHEALEAHFR
jgi:hypothetical protein